MDQVHGPQGGPWTGSTGVVHGPGSMFCIRPEEKLANLRSGKPKSQNNPRQENLAELKCSIVK